jgi:hypothetical protein
MESETDSDAGEPEPSGAESGTPDSTPFDNKPFAPIEPPTPAFDAAPPAQAAPTVAATPPPYPPNPAQPYPGAEGQVPPNVYGYPPYGYGYPSPQAPRGTNGMAIAALVLGICGFLFVTPVVGLVLGIISLAAVNRSGQRGKGMAISGIVLSSLWIALFATIIVVAGVTAKSPAQRSAAGDVVKSGTVPIFELRTGDCFTMPDGLIGSTDSHVRTLPAVPCSSPHDGESAGSYTATEASYPGVNAMRDEARSQCLKMLSDYVFDLQSLPPGSVMQYVTPNSAAWGQGERHVMCFEQLPAATFTGSIHREASSYTADQQRYLNAFRLVAVPAGQLNAATQDAPLSQLQQGASNVAAGVQSEIAALTSAPWPANIQPAVDGLVTQHRLSENLWSEAATDKDQSSFSSDVQIAVDALDVTDMKAVRDGLGLTTITPGTATTS